MALPLTTKRKIAYTTGSYETNLPAQPYQTPSPPRVPSPRGNPRRPGCAEEAPLQGTQAADPEGCWKVILCEPGDRSQRLSTSFFVPVSASSTAGLSSFFFRQLGGPTEELPGFQGSQRPGALSPGHHIQNQMRFGGAQCVEEKDQGVVSSTRADPRGV